MSKRGKVEVATKTFGFLLIDGFALMSYASVVEPFRAANVLSGEELYRWKHVSVDGNPCRASNGAQILPDATVGDALEIDTLFVVAGGDPARFNDRSTFSWIRRLARKNVRIAGISGGPFILARAGVLDGFRCTIHWDHVPAFSERFPTLILEHGIYVIDRSRLTCAGGTAGLDLATELIERDHGHELGVQVSEWFIKTQSRASREVQRVSLRERYGVRSDPLLKALAKMESSIEERETRESLARRAGVSVRQLERLFNKHLGETINGVYMQIRLDHADVLLRKTGMTVTSVAIACGFGSSSHFSRSYRRQFGRPPSAQP